jgi:hypothetical protein
VRHPDEGSMSTTIPASVDAAAERLVAVARDELQLDFHNAGAALSLALARVTGMALASGIVDEPELDELLSELRSAAMAYSSSGVVVANEG